MFDTYMKNRLRIERRSRKGCKFQCTEEAIHPWLPYFFLVFVAAVMSYARPANAAPVTWDFIEISCIASAGECTGGPGTLLATLGLPDINAIGGYSFHAGPNQPPTETETGDPFTFQYFGAAGIIAAPVPHNSRCYNPNPFPPLGINTCDFTLGFTSSASGLGIRMGFSFLPDDPDTVIDLMDTTAKTASDDPVAGCSVSSRCTITGIWESAAVPEPGSVALLTTALALLGYLVTRKTRQCERSS